MVIGIHISISRYVCTKNYKKLIILTFTFHRFETPTNERRQGSIPKEAPWKTSVNVVNLSDLYFDFATKIDF